MKRAPRLIEYRVEGGTLRIENRAEGKRLCASPRVRVFDALEGTWAGEVKVCPLSPANAKFLRARFPFTVPVAMPLKCASFGTGDRLGIATPGHLRAIRKFDVFPILAQQSMRELSRTGRTAQEVIDSATFGVFEAGWEDGFGADADHIKTSEDAVRCFQTGFTMFTVDAADHINKQGKSAEEIYGKAIMHIISVYQALKTVAEGRAFTFEVSIDETDTDTLPDHHAYVAKALKAAGVHFQSLAPKFVGEFQKGIDYRGDVKEFERQFKAHAKIAREIGGYKISVHSGSDKFSIFPIVGKQSKGFFHCKTAGTSWLEAVRVAAVKAPALYRKMHAFALTRFQEDRKSYHVTTDLAVIPDLATLPDSELPGLPDKVDSRQLMHITYGSLLSAKDKEGQFLFRDEFYKMLFDNEATHYQFLERHMERHLTLLGAKKRS